MSVVSLKQRLGGILFLSLFACDCLHTMCGSRMLTCNNYVTLQEASIVSKEWKEAINNHSHMKLTAVVKCSICSKKLNRIVLKKAGVRIIAVLHWSYNEKKCHSDESKFWFRKKRTTKRNVALMQQNQILKN